MNREDLLKEIEENVKKIGYEDKNGKLTMDGEILRDIYLDKLTLGSSVTEDSLEKDKLEDIYKNRISEEGKKIYSYKEEVKYLVATVSFSIINNNILDELPIEKTLKLFDGIEKVFLFYTNSVKENYKKIEQKLKTKGLEVEGTEVNETLTDIRKYLNSVLKKSEDSKKILIDITAGLKIASISMYKFSVENGIRAINWKEIQLPKYKREIENTYVIDGKQDRVPFSTRLEQLKEAREENRKMLSDINEALDRGEYKTVANYYERLDRLDEAFFFDELSKLYNFENFIAIDSKKFYEKAKNFLDKILKYKAFEEKTKNKIKDFILFLKVLSDTDDEGFFENDIEEDKMANYYQKEIVNFSYKGESFTLLEYIKDSVSKDDTIIDDEEHYLKEEIYFYLVLRFFEKRLTEESEKEKILLYLKEDIFQNKKKKEVEKIDDSFKSYYENLFEKVNEKTFYVALKIFEIADRFKDKLEEVIVFKDEEILELKNYGLFLNLKEILEENKLKLDKPIRELIKAILNTANYSITLNELEKVDYFRECIKEGKIKRKNQMTYKNRLSTFKTKIVPLINQKINEELSGNALTFFEVVANGTNTIYRINENFR